MAVIPAYRGVNDLVVHSAGVSVAQTGNGASTNVIDRGPAHKAGILKITTTVGATPTCTYQIEVSQAPTSGFVNATYADVSTPTSNSTATFAITSATTVQKIVKQTATWRYVRVTMSANTNVTNTIDFVFSDDKTLLS